MTARPLSQLADDLREFVEKGRELAGPKVIVKLQEQGPWWTGDFGRRWKLSSTPVKPIELPENMVREPFPLRTERPGFFEPPALRVSPSSPLYIGNSVSYAGFAVGRDEARLYRPPSQRRNSTKERVNYEEHKKAGYKLTSKGARPDWYDIYTDAENGGLLDTLDEAFEQALRRVL